MPHALISEEVFPLGNTLLLEIWKQLTDHQRQNAVDLKSAEQILWSPRFLVYRIEQEGLKETGREGGV